MKAFDVVSSALFCLLSASAVAQVESSRAYIVAGRTIGFVEQNGMLVSEGCAPASAPNASHVRCLATRALEKASLKRLKSANSRGGDNPGARICVQLTGKILLGRDDDGNENAFCVFTDGSAASAGAFVRAGAINDDRSRSRPAPKTRD